jgi:hypothetical protein
VNVEAERTAIRRLLDQYVQAYESLDEGRVRQIDPSFLGLDRRTRPLLRALQLRLSIDSVELSDDGQEARVTATQAITYDWARAELPKAPPPQKKTWRLRKAGTEWRIVP